MTDLKTLDKARRLKRAEANEKARALLWSMLSESQREEFDRYGYFTARGNGRVFRISCSAVGGLVEVTPRERRWATAWCVAIRGRPPLWDTMLAQKLMIESGNVEELRRIAGIQY